MGRFTPTLRARLTLWYCLVLAVMLVVLGVVADAGLSRILLTRTDVFIADGVSGFATGVRGELGEHADTRSAISDAFHEVRFPDLRLVLLDDSLGIAGSSLVGAPPMHVAAGDTARLNDFTHRQPAGSNALDIGAVIASLRDLTPEQRERASFNDADDDFRINTQTLTLSGERFLLVGAYPLNELHAVLTQVRRSYLVAFPIVLLAVAIGGQLLATRGLSPLTEMVRRADRISESNLHERLPVTTPGDELGTLALVVNRLLGRLESAFTDQRRFMADASHELRTPIAILQSEVDITLARAHRSNEEYRTSTMVMRDTAQRLNRIVDDLFLMSRADAGHLAIRHDAVDLEAVVDDTVRAARQMAAQRGVQLELRPLEAAPVSGDADLLGRLLLNLVDNAIKYSQPGGAVTVELRADDAAAEVTVTDEGEGIPPEAQTHIFERFFRVDTARSRSEASATSGAGLGLAISRWIAEGHGGTLELVHSAPGDTRFRVRLPMERVAS